MTVRPTLVVMSWRGGARFERCLASISGSRAHFDRVILSITSAPDSPDMEAATRFASVHEGIEVLCTGRELPTMEHQAFWVDHLSRSGMRPDEWIYWLAYDDQVRGRGIDSLVDAQGNWPLEWGTAYIGPWAMRHEAADEPYSGPWDEPLESWTSFPAGGPIRLPVLDWIGRQLAQPTYMQMSGSVTAFESFLALRHAQPPKAGPMRIEMAIAASPPNLFVEEFAEPVSIIYGRSNSDRAAYGRAARSEDAHLMRWLARYLRRDPRAWTQAAAGSGRVFASYASSLARERTLPVEEWRVRGNVLP